MAASRVAHDFSYAGNKQRSEPDRFVSSSLTLALREVSETPNTCWQNLEKPWEENREVRSGSARRHSGSEGRVKEWAPAPAWAGIYMGNLYIFLSIFL